MSAPAQPLLKLRLTPAAERQVKLGHPWVFADRIKETNREGKTGELAIVYDREDKFLAAGLFDAASPICLRVFHRGKPAKIDTAWWLSHFDAALKRREGLFDTTTTGYRLVNGESDGWPGLVLDQYAEVLVLKLYTASWLPRLKEVLATIAQRFPERAVVLRLSRNIYDAAAKIGLKEGVTVAGKLAGNPVQFLENGLTFEADVQSGQKTGFFLDQRDNRQRVRELAKGGKVLNVFSFTGGFSIYAAAGGATTVTSVDISPHALAGLKRHGDFNREAIGDCPLTLVQADAFEWLARPVAQPFELVILDPPSLAKREAERAGAIEGYRHLVAQGARWVANGGILIAASCSAHVSKEEFFGAVKAGLERAGCRTEPLFEAEHAADHPATFAEAKYLKCMAMRLRRKA